MKELEQENLTLLNTIAQYPDCFPEKDKQVLNKFAIEKKIEALKNCINDNKAYNNEIDVLIIYVDDVRADIEQLRKEQASE